MLENNGSSYVTTAFARQPIFTGKRQVWGYELLYRGKTDAENAQYSDEDVATLSVVAGSLMDYSGRPGQKCRTFVHFGEAAVLRDIPLALEPERTGILVRAGVVPSAGFLEALARLKRQNYLIGLNNFQGVSGDDALIRLCDLIFIDCLGNSPEEVRRLAAQAKEYGGLLVAKRIEDMARFEDARDMGFDLFQGFFFQKPEIVPGRSISSAAVSKLSIFKVISQGEPDPDELNRVLQADVSLSYRFLRFANSAIFGLKKVDSIRHALLLIGWNRIKSWLWLMVLTDLNPPHKPSELPYLSAVRGRFMAVCAERHSAPRVSPDLLFMLGLFSLLDAMLDATFNDLVASLPIDEKVKEALCGKVNEYHDWLSMAKCFESGDWNVLDGLVAGLALNPSEVAGAYCEAADWTRSFYRVDCATGEGCAELEGDDDGPDVSNNGLMLFDPLQESLFARILAYVKGFLR